MTADAGHAVVVVCTDKFEHILNIFLAISFIDETQQVTVLYIRHLYIFLSG